MRKKNWTKYREKVEEDEKETESEKMKKMMNDIMKAVPERKKKSYDEILEFEMKNVKSKRNENRVRDEKVEKTVEKVVREETETENDDENVIETKNIEKVKFSLRMPKLKISDFLQV